MDEIRANTKLLLDGIAKGEDDPNMRAMAGAAVALLTGYLLDVRRTADALEKLAARSETGSR